MTSVFGNAIQFLNELGVYEIVLPFLLVFTIMFAILEKSRIFGLENIDGREVTKKNLNSMFAFVVAFFFVASSRLVATINEALANVVLLMLLGICFLLLTGVFHTGKKEFEGPYKGLFNIVMLVGIFLIFLHAIKTDNGTPWLYMVWGWVAENYNSSAIAALILTLGFIGLMAYITAEPGSGPFGIGGGSKSSSKKED